MAASTVGITGSGPLSVTDKNGAQHFVPLSAFKLGGSDVTLKTDWVTQIDSQHIDAVLLQALAQARFRAGELAAPPAPRVGPAILFTAQQIGPEGNGISVAVTPDGLTDVTLVATQTLVYPGLTSGAMAQAKIGDTSGTGPVQVVPGASTDPPGGCCADRRRRERKVGRRRRRQEDGLHAEERDDRSRHGRRPTRRRHDVCRDGQPRAADLDEGHAHRRGQVDRRREPARRRQDAVDGPCRPRGRARDALRRGRDGRRHRRRQYSS